MVLFVIVQECLCIYIFGLCVGGNSGSGSNGSRLVVIEGIVVVIVVAVVVAIPLFSL